ncbi:hypothetical protein NDU88_008396 [Pleurodeles waltl]|uniref:Uncharacterized protein n=1 Tax=Pleurodeles waltl TaxID=8319 RepID=A0AAV7NW54_PLEWA|nr:hypothetical protein NDU88_008396 [Pleurodeles waltl]
MTTIQTSGAEDGTKGVHGDRFVKSLGSFCFLHQLCLCSENDFQLSLACSSGYILLQHDVSFIVSVNITIE